MAVALTRITARTSLQFTRILVFSTTFLLGLIPAQGCEVAQLVTDREQHTQDRLCDLIRCRPPAVTPAGAIRDFVLESVDAIRGIAPEMWRGELGYLAAISPTVHRLALELTDRQAVAPALARVPGGC